MGFLMSANHSDLWLLAGWTMVHFLWLGTAVGLATVVCRWLLRRASANIRYVVTLSGLVLLTALPAVIAGWISFNSHELPVRAGDGSTPFVPALTTAVVSNASAMSLPKGVVEPDRPDADLSTGSSVALTKTAQRAPIVALEEAGLTPRPVSAGSLIDFASRCIPYLPWFWIIGTPITFAVTATGLIGTRRLRSASRIINDGPIADTLVRLVDSLGVTQRVGVAVCERIVAPVLIGIVRPLILLPPAALSSYSPEEIEMVLLHELAHVRRWDNLVNLIQRLIESLLFFHPAVWLVSSWVRREREACCDSLVVARTDHPHAYAELLVALAAQMPRSVLFHPAASSAMAAGPLRARIRQVLKLDDDPMLVSGKSLTVILASLLVAGTLAAIYFPATASAASEDKKQEVQTQNNLKNQILALLNYEAAHKSFPASAIFGGDGKPLLSWRVAILPFIGEAKLYDEFHRDEPWNSEHNRTLIARMPNVFKNPKVNEVGMTNYLAVVGDECFMTGTAKKLGLKHITDGTSLTASLVEADPSLAVEWTRPLDWKFDRDRPTQGLGKVWGDHWNYARVDGSLHQVKNNRAPDEVGILFTRNGRETKSLAESANRRDQAPPGMPGGEGGPADVSTQTRAESANSFGTEDEKAPSGPGAMSAIEPKIIAELPEDWQNGGSKGFQEFLKAVSDIQKKNLRPDVVWRDGKNILVALPQPKESDWPHMLGDSPRKERVIAEKAWQQLGVKLAPLTGAEMIYRLSIGHPAVLLIIGGNVPKGLPLPSELVKLNGNSIESMDSLLTWLGDTKGKQLQGVKVNASAGGREYLFESQPATVTAPPTMEQSVPQVTQAKPNRHRFPSLEDQKLADLAWKRLQLELEPIGVEELKRVKSLGYEGGVTVTDIANRGAANGAFNDVQPGDILVGLHVWPVTNLHDVATVLQREDVAELSPLKFYVVRPSNGSQDNVEFSGRIPVKELRPAAELPASKSTPTLNSRYSPALNSSVLPAKPEYDIAPQSSQIARSPNEPGRAALPYIPQIAFDNRPSTSALPWVPGVAPLPAVAPTIPIAPPVPGISAERRTDRLEPNATATAPAGEHSLLKRETGNVSTPANSPATKTVLVPIPDLKPTFAGSNNRTANSDAYSVNRDASTPKKSETSLQTAQKNARYSAENSATQTDVLRADAIVINGPEQVKIGGVRREGSDRATLELQTTRNALPPTAANESKAAKTPDDPVTIIAHEIPEQLKEDVERYIDRIRGRARSRWDDRGRLIMQAPRSRHEDLEKLLKFTAQWRDNAARSSDSGSFDVRKAGGEDVLEWRSTGLTFVRGMSADALQRLGVCVGSVAPGSPAAWYDVRPGDNVVGVAGFQVESVADLASILKTLREGYRTEKRIDVNFYRNPPGQAIRAEFPLTPGIVDHDVNISMSRYRRGANANRSKQESKIDNSPAQSIKRQDPNEKGNGTTQPATPDKSKLSYDGKSFDEWRNVWQSELSIDKRVEAVKAMAAFGANGYGREAAEAILAVVGQYDWKSIGDNKDTESLQNACLKAFGALPSEHGVAVPSISATDALPSLAVVVKSDNVRQKMFAIWVLSYLERSEAVSLILELSKDQDANIRQAALRSLPNPGSKGYDEQINARVREALNSDDPGEVAAAMATTFPLRASSNAPAPYPYLNEFSKWIFSPHESVRKQARNLASSLEPDDASRVVDMAVVILKDSSKEKQHIEAIRALAALGPNAKSAVDTLRPFVKSDKAPTVIAATAALERILSPADYGKVLFEEFGKRFRLRFTGKSILPEGDQEEFQAFRRDVNREALALFH